MNEQGTRTGKMQLELDKRQVSRLIGWLAMVGTEQVSDRDRNDVREFIAWLEYRAARRWGGSNA